MVKPFYRLFNSPKRPLTPPIGKNGDGTYLHKDDVFTAIVKEHTPLEIYKINWQFLEAFSETVVNYAPISVNIMDFWSKFPLEQVVIPIEGEAGEKLLERLDKHDDRKVVTKKGIRKAYWVNAVLKLQEHLAFQFLNNLYSTATATKYSHTLRQKIYRMFELWGLDEVENRELLFSRINKLFKEERFITNKDYNLRKGKKIAFDYAARAAWDAQIEGPLTSISFFLDYFDDGAFQYRIESVLLPPVYDSFVNPLAHPIGMTIDYLKVCKVDLVDYVLSKKKWRADAVTVKCTYASDTRADLPPSMKTPWKKNPNFDPNEPPSAANPEWIYDLPFPAARPNTETILNDGSLDGPWDPSQDPPLPHRIIATYNGINLPGDENARLWENIREMDEGQGNILVDIETGLGSFMYSGMEYTKWLFENGAYLIDYACQLPNGKYQHIIEYYRYDVFDTSIHYNSIASGTEMPRYAYPTIEHTNLINGILNDKDECGGPDIDKDGPYPFGYVNPYENPPMPPMTLDQLKIRGYDSGYWLPTPDGWERWMSGLSTYPFWDENTNILNTNVQFTKVHSLIARWIETRECVVEAFNLRSEMTPSIDEWFKVNKICYLDNIVHDKYKGDRNIIHNDINIVNHFHNEDRYDPCAPDANDEESQDIEKNTEDKGKI